jgi:hypothetical protein
MAKYLFSPPMWTEGQRVQALWLDDGKYYPGEIVKVRRDGVTVDFRWDDGTETKNMPVEHLKRRRGRPTSSQLDSTASVVKLPVGSKQQAFRRLAQQRTEKALNYIRLIENLSDRRNYRWTPGEAAKIFTALRHALDNAERKFSEGVSTSFELG